MRVIDLPDGFVPHERTAQVLDDESVLLTGWMDDRTRWVVVRAAGSDARVVVSEPTTDHGPGWPVLALPDGAFAVVTSPTDIRVWTEPDGPAERVVVENPEAVTGFGPAVALSELTPRSSGGTPQVILRDRVAVQETPAVAGLHLDVGTGTARWSAPYLVDASSFPPGDAVVVGSTLATPDTTYAFVEGSRRASVNRAGMDFAACVELTPTGDVARTVYSTTWPDEPGTHGLTGTVVAGGTYAILTPVSASGPWQGRQRILCLPVEELFTPELPSGLTEARIVEHHYDGWWLLHGNRLVHTPLDLALSD